MAPVTCTNCTKIQYQATVKLHGVFPSCARVTCIFTGTIISPSLWLRQCPNRYTFRAGRNLPDKEFRYLRTVIVTAAVYWGFSSELRTLTLSPTFQHRAGVTPILRRLRRELCFAKQSLGPIHCGFPLRKHPSPEVTGSFAEFLTRVLSHTLDSLLAYLCRFAVQAPFIAGSGESKTSLHKELPHHSSAFTISGFAYLSA